MKKIISIDEAAQFSEIVKLNHQSIILAGGCFDVLHPGHIKFLSELKKIGDKLFLLLESDENIKKHKGKGRPINPQNARAIVLSSLSTVDYVITLKGMTKNQDYDKLIVQINPDYIAITDGDKNIQRRIEQCDQIGAKLVIINKLEGFSSSNYINSTR